MANVLLVVTGGIAAYKTLDLIRRLRERGHTVPVVMSEAAQRFVTPLSVGALSNAPVLTELWDLDREREIGHIRLARSADVVMVAPASADFLARMATGLADDLASAVLLATGAPVVVAPAMNPFMWQHPATQRNVARLAADGVRFVDPEPGEMAERGEAGVGRLAETAKLLAAIEDALGVPGPLAGRHVLVTSGPTHEPIDPVRYIANRSSGRQGHAIAAAAAKAGAKVTLVSGPVNLADPAGASTVKVESARQMLSAVENALPADVAVFAAAVADWRVEEAAQKLKKGDGSLPTLVFSENPDILASVSRAANRPELVVGFAAETQNVLANAKSKLARKGCDWIVANDVSEGVFGADTNTVHLVSAAGTEAWPTAGKDAVATKLVARIAKALATQ